jgi:hypothetical protein
MRTLNRIRQIAIAAILTAGAAQASPAIADLGSMLVTAERSASVADLGAMTVMAPRDGRVADLGTLTVTAPRLVTVAAARQAKRPIG